MSNAGSHQFDQIMEATDSSLLWPGSQQSSSCVRDGIHEGGREEGNKQPRARACAHVDTVTIVMPRGLVHLIVFGWQTRMHLFRMLRTWIHGVRSVFVATAGSSGLLPSANVYL